MKYAAAAAILLAAPLAAASPATGPTGSAKTSRAAKSAKPAPAKTASAAPVRTAPARRALEAPRLRHETIELAPAYGVGSERIFANKEDDTSIGRSLETTTAAAPRAPVAGAFQAVEATVLRKRPKATGRIRVSFDVDRRGKVVRPMVLGFDRALDRAIESQLRSSKLPADYAGQHMETVLSFKSGKLLRR